MGDTPNIRAADHPAVHVQREGYEISYLARRHGISTTQVRTLVSRFGNDWVKLDQAAKALKKS